MSDRPFPWKCPDCKQDTVNKGVLKNYFLHEKLIISDLPVAICDNCNCVLFTNATDDVITAHLKGFYEPSANVG